jgi:Uma2 family endonuclease
LQSPTSSSGSAGSAVLVIEVAGDSLRLDRGSKAALYARAGIPEYWIVNLAESTVEILRQPDTSVGAYRSRVVAARDDLLTAIAVPGLSFEAAALFR